MLDKYEIGIGIEEEEVAGWRDNSDANGIELRLDISYIVSAEADAV